MKIISIVGRPNVGKSTLFNVLTKSRDAIVGSSPGLTRDRHYGKIYLNDYPLLLVDTGGLEINNKDNIVYKMAEQTQLAIDESDFIFFIVDGRVGITSTDIVIANILRKKNKKILLLINKSEGLNIDVLNSEFLKFGIKEKICISSAHRENINLIYEFLDKYILDKKASIGEIQQKDDIAISVLGKPNVGKSTLINSFLGEERFISYDKPGTTRDSVSAHMTFKDKNIQIIDTAGIRKKGRIEEKFEKFSILKSLLSISRSDISILVIDAHEGLTSQDLQIYGYIVDEGNALVVAVNKWDLLDSYQKDNFKKAIDKKINIFGNYQIFYVSALKKIGLNNILDGIIKAYTNSIKRIPTPTINKFIHDLQVSHQPPMFKGIRPKLKYAHQGDTSPPTFIIHGNHLIGIKKDYLKYIESSIIKTFEFYGTPIKIRLNESENPFEQLIKKPISTGLVTRRKQINKRRDKIKKNK